MSYDSTPMITALATLKNVAFDSASKNLSQHLKDWDCDPSVDRNCSDVIFLPHADFVNYNDQNELKLFDPCYCILC